MRGTDVESAAYKSEAIAGIHETMKGLYKSGERIEHTAFPGLDCR